MKLIKNDPRKVLFLTGASFIAGGIDCVENELISIAIISFVVAFINIASLFWVRKYPFFIKILMLAVNAVFASSSSYFYFRAGREYIQYGWMAVVVINLIVLIIALRKQKNQALFKNENSK